MLDYRPITTPEYEQVRRFLSDNGWAHRVGDPERFARMIAGSNRTVVAWDNQQVIGFARALCDGISNGYLSTVAVSESHRGQGIGRELVRRLMGDDPEITWILRAGRGSEGFWAKMGFTMSEVAMEWTRTTQSETGTAPTLEKVGPDQVDELQEIVRLCGEDMSARWGRTHWLPPPPVEIMRRHAVEKDVYAVRQGGEAVATFTFGLSGWPDDSRPYWADPDARAAYVARLAVRPDAQGRGLGRWCMGEAERLAREQGCASVRLDAIADFPGPLALYRTLGYEERGTIVWTNWHGVARTLILMEKSLSPSLTVE